MSSLSVTMLNESELICLEKDKYFSDLLCNAINSVKYLFTVKWLQIDKIIIYFSLTHRWDPKKYYHSR